MSRQVTVLDTTLREVELHAGIYHTPQSRERIGIATAELGTPRIEFGLAYPGRVDIHEVEPAINAIKGSYPNTQVILQCRAHKDDLKLLTKYKNIDGAGTYIAISQSHREKKLNGISLDVALDRLVGAMDFLKSHGYPYRRATLEHSGVFFSPYAREEDTMENFLKAIRTVDKAGATVISIPDTSGLLSTHETRSMFRTARKVTTKELAVHMHNDMSIGQGLMNSFAAANAGGDEIHVTLCGFGARNGIPDHYSFSVSLPRESRGRLYTGERRELFRQLYDVFEDSTGIPIPSTHPLSRNAQTEKAGTHQKGQLKDLELYIPPEKVKYDFGNHEFMEAGIHMSPTVIKSIIGPYAEATEERIRYLTGEIIARSRLKGRISPYEVRDLIEAKGGINIPIDHVTKIIRGSDFGYILVELKSQADDLPIKKHIVSLDGVINADTTYGGIPKGDAFSIDVVVTGKLKDSQGRELVDRIRKLENVNRTIALPTD